MRKNSRTRIIQRKKAIPFRHNPASKRSSRWVVIATTAISLISTSGLIASIAISRYSDLRQTEKFEASSIQSGKELENQKTKYTKQINFLEMEKEFLTTELSHWKNESRKLSENLRIKEKELLETKGDLTRAKALSNNNPTRELRIPSNLTQPSVPPSEAKKIIAWSKRNTTIVFPVLLNITEEKVNLHDRGKKVELPVLPGGKVTAIGYHPSSPKYLIVSLPHSQQFLASVTISNTNFIDAIQPSFRKHVNSSVGK